MRDCNKCPGPGFDPTEQTGPVYLGGVLGIDVNGVRQPIDAEGIVELQVDAQAAADSAAEAAESAEEAAASATAAETSRGQAAQNATDAAGSATAAAQSAVEAQTAAERDVPAAAAAWLSEHVDPETGYVLDDSLTIQGAAADAKKTGDAVSDLKKVDGGLAAGIDTLSAVENHTINLLDPDALTTGYWLVGNVPTARANYWYSDYIKIGMVPFCYRDQGASISYLVSCYDADKNYLGAIDYATAGYERIINDGTFPSNYYRITPKDGTVYIRVNGRYATNLMLTPFFYPTKYIAYGDIFTKDSLNMAMFGDSITYGTDGNTSERTDKNLAYWLAKNAPFVIDNYGEGSMGWVSTQYNPRIAYDRLQEADLTKYDVITLCFGVNDSAATMGNYDSTDESTIMGQVNKCVKYIGAQNPSARIIIIAPWNGRQYGSFPDWRYASRTSGGFTRAELSEELEKAAKYYYIGFISQKDSPINGFGLGTVDNQKTGPYLGSDNVHPSEAGYKAMGAWLAAKITSIVL